MREKLNRLLEYESVRKVRDDLSLKSGSPGSLRNYLTWIHVFLKRSCLDPDEFIEKARASEVDATDEYNRFIIGLKDRGLANNSIASAGRSVRKFFDVNDIQLNKFYKVKAWVKHSDRAPSKEELRMVLHHGDLRENVIITFLASSGVRVSTLVGLKVGDVELGEEKMPSKIFVRPEASKTRKSYNTFITPEATSLLREYLDSRKRTSEKVGDESLLIRNERYKMEAKALTVDGLTQAIRRLFRKAGLVKQAKGNIRARYQLHPHSLRKYFDTQLAVAGVQQAFKEYFLGHTGGLDKNYFRPTEEMLDTEYRKAIPYLTVMETSTISREEVRAEVIGALMGKISDTELAPIARKLGISPNQIRAMIRRIGVTGSEEETEALLENERNARNEENCNHCESKIVTEDELCGYLNEDWDLIKELSNGKLIIRRKVEA